jgi:N-acylglucosamine-6-phosphate 2-epimerase
MMQKKSVFQQIKGGLIVSCQALTGEPLYGPHIMARMALAASMGGAVGIRANTVADVNAIRKMVGLPIIGLIKREYNDSEVYISPTLKEVKALIRSAANIIALDATLRKRPGGVGIAELIAAIKNSGKMVLADVSTFEEGVAAQESGADIVSTTMSGYTSYSPQLGEPDYELIQKLSRTLKVPVFAEGRINHPEKMFRCFQNGAYCVVVGAAITRPQLITKSFVAAIPQRT